MIRSFLKDRRGSYALIAAVALLPIMGALSLAVDYSQMLREKQAMRNALDAAGIATARQVVSDDDDALIAYAEDFFQANLGPVDPADTDLHVALPDDANGGGTLTLTATLRYHPYFYPVFSAMLGRKGDPLSSTVSFSAETSIRLKNTLEVALVLDNSGSMDYFGAGSGEKRIDLLKAAAKELVTTLSKQAKLIKQVDKPVQFGLVPFAASVNVGPSHADEPWMDRWGISPVHHENFDWSSLDDPQKGAEKRNGVWYKKGSGWGAAEGEVLTRFSLYRDISGVASRQFVPDEDEEEQCVEWDDGDCEDYERGHFDETLAAAAGWKGCVEARPYPYNVDDTAPNAGVGTGGVVYGDPETLFVPMFAPDEPGDVWETEDDSRPDDYDAANNWWNDGTESKSGRTRLTSVKKYFETRPYDVSFPPGAGPNYSCTTGPITPLVDVTTEEGLTTIKDAIDAMAPEGGTNVPEGLAWGWRVVSGGEPFTQGRPDDEKGNDKVVIVLTDGANTYYTPRSLGFDDKAGAKSTYAAYGYLQPGYDGGDIGRLFLGTGGDVGKYDYSTGNYTKALNQQMQTLCANAKAEGVMVMTVSLDLDSENDAAAIGALKACASESRFRSDPDDPSKPARLYWNATGADLAEKFEEIADELSNLRIVG